MRTHLQGSRPGWAACGAYTLDDATTTLDADEVECKHCLRIVGRRGEVVVRIVLRPELVEWLRTQADIVAERDQCPTPTIEQMIGLVLYSRAGLLAMG